MTGGGRGVLGERGLRVVLIQPGAPVRNAFERQGRSNLPPLGLLYLAAALEQAGHQVRVIDLHLPGEDRSLVERVCAGAPQVVGLSTLAPALPLVQRLAHQLRRRLPRQTLLLAGGPDATTRPGLYADLGCFDAIMVGEAEQTLVQLCQAWPEVPRMRGVLVPGDPLDLLQRPAKVDPNAVPLPARHLLPLARYRGGPAFKRQRRSTSLFTHRGCSYSCTFCEKGVHDGPVRYRSAEGILEEVRRIQRDHGICDIRFIDDVFLLNQRRVHQFLDLVLSSGERFSWISTARADLLTEPLLWKLKRAGCYRLELGIESGSDRVLALVNKGMTRQQAVEALRMCRRVGMESITNFILGFPSESEDEIQQTVDFSLELDAEYAVYFTFVPFAGASITHSLPAGAEAPAGGAAQQVSGAQLQRLVDQAYGRFYFRPLSAWRRLSRIRSGWILWDLARMAGLHAAGAGARIMGSG